MANRAGHSISIEPAIDVGFLSERARNHGDRIVTTVIVSRELDALAANQDVDAGPVKRRAKRVRMQRLAPLVVRLFVTVSAILGLRKSAGLNEIVSVCGGVTGQREVARTEAEIEGLANLFGVVRTIERSVGLHPGAEMHRSQEPGGAHHEADDDADQARLHHEPCGTSAHGGSIANNLQLLSWHRVHSGIAHRPPRVNNGDRKIGTEDSRYICDFSNSSAFWRSAAASSFLPWRSSALAMPRCASA